MSKPDLTTSLCILNETDRPCMYLLCRDIAGRIIYVNKYLRRRYPNLKSKEKTYLLDYGFIFNEDEGKYVLRYPSRVKYPNGKIRQWQGRKSFTYDEIVNFDGRSSDEGLEDSEWLKNYCTN